MRVAGLILAVLLAFTFSCGPMAHEGTKIDASKRDQIVKYKTTAKEVEGMFGKPYKVEKMGAGKERYVYWYKYEEYVHWYTLPKTMVQRMDVDILNGVVTDYFYNVEEMDPMKAVKK